MTENTAAFWQVLIGALSLMVLTATLIALIFYTLYTYRTQQQLVRQIRLSIMPGFALHTYNPDYPLGLKIMNVGNGVAINVAVKPVRISGEHTSGQIVRTHHCDSA